MNKNNMFLFILLNIFLINENNIQAGAGADDSSSEETALESIKNYFQNFLDLNGEGATQADLDYIQSWFQSDKIELFNNMLGSETCNRISKLLAQLQGHTDAQPTTEYGSAAAKESGLVSDDSDDSQIAQPKSRQKSFDDVPGTLDLFPQEGFDPIEIDMSTFTIGDLAKRLTGGQPTAELTHKSMYEGEQTQQMIKDQTRILEPINDHLNQENIVLFNKLGLFLNIHDKNELQMIVDFTDPARNDDEFNRLIFNELRNRFIDIMRISFFKTFLNQEIFEALCVKFLSLKEFYQYGYQDH